MNISPADAVSRSQSFRADPSPLERLACVDLPWDQVLRHLFTSDIARLCTVPTTLQAKSLETLDRRALDQLRERDPHLTHEMLVALPVHGDAQHLSAMGLHALAFEATLQAIATHAMGECNHEKRQTQLPPAAVVLSVGSPGSRWSSLLHALTGEAQSQVPAGCSRVPASLTVGDIQVQSTGLANPRMSFIQGADGLIQLFDEATQEIVDLRPELSRHGLAPQDRQHGLLPAMSCDGSRIGVIKWSESTRGSVLSMLNRDTDALSHVDIRGIVTMAAHMTDDGQAVFIQGRHIYSCDGRDVRFIMELPREHRCTISPDGRFLAYQRDGSPLQICDLRSRFGFTLGESTEDVQAVAFSPLNAFAVTLDAQGTCRFFDVRHPEGCLSPVHEFDVDVPPDCCFIAFQGLDGFELVSLAKNNPAANHHRIDFGLHPQSPEPMAAAPLSAGVAGAHR